MKLKLLSLIPVAVLAATLTANAQFNQANYSSTIVETNVTALGSGTTLALPVLNLNAVGNVTLTNITLASTNVTVVTTNSATGVFGTNTVVQQYLLTNTVTQTLSGYTALQIAVSNPGTDTVLVAWGSASATNSTAAAAQWRPIPAGTHILYRDVIPRGYLNAISKSTVTAPLQVEVLLP